MSAPRPQLPALSLLLLAAVVGRAAAEPVKRQSLEIVVDLVNVQNGRIPVSMKLQGVPGTRFLFTEPGTDPEYRYHDVQFFDGDGRSVPFTKDGRQYRLAPFAGDTLEARYAAEPGGVGRHGVQGFVGEDFATFDGRLYLRSLNARLLASAGIRYVAPEGWSVASPFRRDGDWYRLDAFGPRMISTMLAETCVGVGRFDQQSDHIGETELRIATYSGWDAEHKKTLVDKTRRLYAYFHDTLGFDLGVPVVVVWTPKKGRLKVFGGASATANCFEQPYDTPANWRLLAHRIGHAMNKYPPSGMNFREDEDDWFREGWASFMEVRATRAAGLAEDESYFDSLYRTYKGSVARRPATDIPLADERRAKGDVVEFVHYKKAPLVVRMLEYLMVERSGKTMEAFMRAMWNKYGWFESSLPVEQELEAFTEAKFDDFWEMMIAQRGVVIPVWKEYVTAEVREDMRRRPAARVGGQPLSGDYLHHLSATGDFDTFRAVRDFLIVEETRRRLLASRGVRLYPDEIRDHLFALPPDDRYAIALLEASYPLDLAPAPPQAGGGEPAPVDLVIDTRTEDGRVFSELLSLEDDYLSAVSSGAPDRVVVRPSGGRTARAGETFPLGFAANASINVGAEWPAPLPRFEIEVLSGETVTKRLAVDVGRRSNLAWSAPVDPADRAPGDGIVAVRVRAEDGTSVTRAFWQRGRLPEHRRHVPRPVPASRASRSKAESR